MAKTSLNLDDDKYKVYGFPPWYICAILGFQHYISMLVGSLSVPFLLSPLLLVCLGDDQLGRSQLLCTLFVSAGISTALQVLFGVRLAVVQAGTFAILAPTLSYLSLPENKCPLIIEKDSNLSCFNSTSCLLSGSSEHQDLWHSRLREIQGSIMASSVLEIVFGFCGVMGFLQKYIGPLTISPTITLLGTSLFSSAADYASQQWWIALMTIVLIVLFSQHFGQIDVPCAMYVKKEGCRRRDYPLLKMFPVVIGIVISWIICALLTVANVFTDDPNSWGYYARTDIKSNVLSEAPWFRMPYPGQWGRPSVSLTLVCSLLSGYLASMIQSMGDYTNCARLSGAPPPPRHAVNRGIGVEGLACLLVGAFGSGNATSSTSINVGVVSLTKTGSRVIVLYTAGMMILFGVFAKFGALFVTIPQPIIGGAFFILFGMIVAVGLSSVQSVNMNSSRNIFVLGFSIFFGLTISEWVKKNPSAIRTGSSVADNIFTVLFSTSMFLGGLVGFILDNSIPGSREERGMPPIANKESEAVEIDPEVNPDGEAEKDMHRIYDLPFGMSCIQHSSWTRKIPFCPTYGKEPLHFTHHPHVEREIETVAQSIHKLHELKSTSSL